MLDPYRMIVINIIASALILLGILLFKVIYPKRPINLFILLILISLLPVISIFRQGAYESGDFNIHIYRIMAFFDILKEGILMPSWAAQLNSSYGNPLFIFNYSLPYYVISFFHLLGIDFITSTKLYLGLVFYLSGITMYIAVKEILNNKLAAFTAAIFYLFSPYHLIDVHFRATLGESTLFLIAPLLFLFISKYHKKNKIIYLILNSLLTGAMVMAHPLLAVAYCAILVLYISFLYLSFKKIKLTILSIVSLMIGGIASAYVWISFILFAPFMFSLPTSSFSADPSFYDFKLLFYSPWKLGFLFQGPKGELAQIIGYTQILAVFILLILYLKQKIKRPLQYFILFWISIFLLLIFLMHPISSFFWKHLRLFYMLLPFGRLLLLMSFCTSLLAGYLALILSDTKHKKNIIYLIIIFTIGYTILNWSHRRVKPEITDEVLRANIGRSTLNEGITAYFLNTKWADVNNFWFSDPPKNRIDIVEGTGTVKQIKRTSTLHAYNIDAKTPLTIRENTLFFPGWTLKSNGKHIDIFPGIRGVTHAKLPTGLQYLEFSYEDIPSYKIAKVISVVTFVSLIIGLSCILFVRRFTGKP